VQQRPAVVSVDLSGSRARGTHDKLSDWDFAIRTAAFDSIARDLPGLAEPLGPGAKTQATPQNHGFAGGPSSWDRHAATKRQLAEIDQAVHRQSVRLEEHDDPAHPVVAAAKARIEQLATQRAALEERRAAAREDAERAVRELGPRNVHAPPSIHCGRAEEALRAETDFLFAAAAERL
jgi:hypothetical protein